MLAWRGSEGCESQVKLDEKEKDDVVGSTNGYGIVRLGWHGAWIVV